MAGVSDTRPMSASGVSAFVVAAALLFGSTHAEAQACEPSTAEMTEARALFEAAQAAVDSGRWADAIASFERSYTLSCQPAALFNLAMALRALGRHRDARDQLDRLVELHPDLSGGLRESVDNFRREEAERVAILELVGVDAETEVRLSFDGRLVPDEGERPWQLETDAGTHSLVARIPEHQPFVWDGELTDGQTERVEVVFEAIPTGGEEGGVDVVLIIVPIVLAILIAGAITTGVVLQEQAQLQPHNPSRHIILRTQ